MLNPGAFTGDGSLVSQATTRERGLRDALFEAGLPDARQLALDSPLISSGRLDSVALYGLSIWVESELGRPVDPARIDLPKRWDSIRAILEFLEDPTPSPSSDDVRHAPPPTGRVRTRTLPHGYTVDLVPPGPREDLAGLLTHLWSSDPALNMAVLGWKYAENPYRDQCAPAMFVVRFGGDIVAMRGVVPSLWQTDSGSPPVPVPCVDDLVIHPRHRRRGLFAPLMDVLLRSMRDRGHEAYFSLSALRVTRLQSIAHGARAVATPAPIGLRTPAAAMADSVDAGIGRLPVLWRLRGGGHGLLGAERSFARLDASPHGRVGALSMDVSDSPDGPALASLVDRLGHRGRLRHLRDERFFAWRYRHPLHRYRLIVARLDREVKGYLIVQRGVSDLADPRRTYVVDWEAEDTAVADALFDFTIERGGFHELVVWTTGLASVRIDALRARGFVDVDLENTARGLPSVLVGRVDPGHASRVGSLDEAHLLDPTRWDLRMAYTQLA